MDIRQLEMALGPGSKQYQLESQDSVRHAIVSIGSEVPMRKVTSGCDHPYHSERILHAAIDSKASNLDTVHEPEFKVCFLMLLYLLHHKALFKSTKLHRC